MVVITGCFFAIVVTDATARKERHVNHSPVSTAWCSPLLIAGRHASVSMNEYGATFLSPRG